MEAGTPFTARVVEKAWLPVDAPTLFGHLDDPRHIGAHMRKPSWRTLGMSMDYELDAAQGQALGSRIRITGRMPGLTLRVEEVVSERLPPLRKTWQTEGPCRLLVIDAYRMGFAISPEAGGCWLSVALDYALPGRGAGWLRARLCGPRSGGGWGGRVGRAARARSAAPAGAPTAR